MNLLLLLATSTPQHLKFVVRVHPEEISLDPEIFGIEGHPEGHPEPTVLGVPVGVIARFPDGTLRSSSRGKVGAIRPDRSRQKTAQ
ncbi:MAG: hypothetical protein WBF13_10330 [Candidatus Zixiibacteriota bacterium]